MGTVYKSSPKRVTISNNNASDVTGHSQIVPQGTYIIIMKNNYDINQDLYDSKGNRLSVGVGKTVVSIAELGSDTYHVVGSNFTGSEITTSDDGAYFGLTLIRLK